MCNFVSTNINVKRLSFIKYYCKFIKYDNFSSQQSLVNCLLDALSIVCQQEIINFNVLQQAKGFKGKGFKCIRPKFISAVVHHYTRNYWSGSTG